MSENTIEQMAARTRGPRHEPTTDAVLAREILALREQIELIWETESAASERLDALEAATTRPTDDVDWPATAREWERIAGDRLKRAETAENANRVLHDILAEARAELAVEYRDHNAAIAQREGFGPYYEKQAIKALRERNEARSERDHAQQVIQRVATERDEAVEARKVWMEACHAAQAERDALQQQLDAARGALAKPGCHRWPCRFHELPDCGKPAFDCTCGLALALEPTTPTGGQS